MAYTMTQLDRLGGPYAILRRGFEAKSCGRISFARRYGATWSDYT